MDVRRCGRAGVVTIRRAVVGALGVIALVAASMALLGDPAHASTSGLKVLPTLTISAPAQAIDGTAGKPVVVSADLQGANPTGTVTISVFAPSMTTCQTAWVSHAMAVTGNGTYTWTIPIFDLGDRGLYRWQATYSGDAVNAAVATTCNAPGSVSQYVVGPGASSGLQATAVNGGVRLSWVTPIDDGDAPITGYQIGTSAYPGGTTINHTYASTATTQTIYGLSPSTSYAFTVSALNIAGVGYPVSTPYVKPLPAAGPFASLGAFVDRQYADLLGRAPTASERSGWVSALTAHSAQLGSVDTALRQSSDHTTNVDPVARLYRAYFLRIPDAGGLTYWIGQKRGGRSLDAISAFFAGSTEFSTRYGSLTNAQFVNLIYTNVLGRAGDPDGIVFWTAQLDQHKRTRGQVMTGFSESSEYRIGQANGVTTAVLYVLMLGRAPTAGEYSTQVGQLAGGESVADAAAAIINSSAYATRVHA